MNRLINKTFLVALLIVSIATGCELSSTLEQSDDGQDFIEITDATLDMSSEIEMNTSLIESSTPDALRVRITKVFNEMIREREVWDAIASQIQHRESGNNLLQVAEFTIKDDLIMGFTQLEDSEVGGISLMSVFMNTYYEHFPGSEVNLEDVENILTGLRFNFPEEALTDFDRWTEAGYPLTSSNFDRSTLTKLSRDEAITMIGREAVDQLDDLANIESEEYSLYKNDNPQFNDDIILAILKTSKIEDLITRGAIFSRNSNTEDIRSLAMSQRSNGNFEATLGGVENERLSIEPTNYTPYYYIPTPTPTCTWQLCSDLFSSNTLTNYQKLAEEKCLTFNMCFACCDNPYATGPSYYMMRFEPTSIRCAKTHPYLTVLSQLTSDGPI